MLAPDDVPLETYPPKPTITASLLTQATLATQTRGLGRAVSGWNMPTTRKARASTEIQDARWGDLAAVNPLQRPCESGSTVDWRCPGKL